MRRPAVDDPVARARMIRHQMLLQNYSELEKEFTMKKRRCELLKQKRATLMAEVRFLRRRYRQLLEIQAADQEVDDFHRFQPTLFNQFQESSQVQASEPPLIGKTYLSTDLHPILATVIEEGRNLKALPDSSLPLTKKAKTCSINETGDKKKKKVSWNISEPVEV